MRMKHERTNRVTSKHIASWYRRVLKNVMLACAIAGIGCVHAADQAIYLGDVYINGSQKTFDTSGTVNIGSNNDSVVITNNKIVGNSAERSGIAITKNLADSTVNVFGKEIAISSGWRGIYANPDATFANASSIVNIGNDDTKNLVIEQNQAVDTSANQENGIAIFGYNPKTTINLKAKTIDISSVSRYALLAQNNDDSDFNKANAANLNIKGDSISIINTNPYIDGAGITAYSGSTINITGGLYVKAARAIEARGRSTININTNDAHKTVLDGDIVFGTDTNLSGAIINARLNLNLTGPDSVWTGNLSTYYPISLPIPNRAVYDINITLANGAQWNVKKYNDSTNNDPLLNSAPLTLNNLKLENGVINLTEDLLSDNETVSQNNIVKIENLTGAGGTINVASKVTENGTSLKTAKLVTQTANVTNPLAVNLAGINADSITNVNSVMQNAAKAVTVSDANFSLNQIITVEEGDINGKITATTDGKALQLVHQQENTKLAALGSVTAMNFIQWRHGVSDLHKRMGELRNSVSGVGVWARADGSKYRYGSQNITSKNNSIQIGSDVNVGTRWKVGGAFSYTDGDATYTNGNADNKAYGIALYGSWLADNNLFVDLIGKYSRLSSDYKFGNMKGGLHNNALSFSAEAGLNIPFANIAFIEPQVEFSYGIIYGDTDHTSNGVYLKQDNMKTLIGRTGLRTGLHFNENKGTVYAHASVLHDFEGKVKFYAANDIASTVKRDNLGGTYYEFGLGANYKFTPNCYSYVELERQTHGPVSGKWRWNVGMRFVF